MKNYDTLITRADRRRLRSLINRLRSSGRARKDHLEALESCLQHSAAVSCREIPRNVVTLDSCVALKDIDSRKRLVCTIADPHDATAIDDKVSAASPAGAALLGKRVGQIASWNLGAKPRRFRIEQVLYQPEAAGNVER